MRLIGTGNYVTAMEENAFEVVKQKLVAAVRGGTKTKKRAIDQIRVRKGGRLAAWCELEAEGRLRCVGGLGVRADPRVYIAPQGMVPLHP